MRRGSAGPHHLRAGSPRPTACTVAAKEAPRDTGHGAGEKGRLVQIKFERVFLERISLKKVKIKKYQWIELS
jgi:hypothetical protein